MEGWDERERKYEQTEKDKESEINGKESGKERAKET